MLATMAWPAFQRVKWSEVSKRYNDDAAQVRDGAERYAMENGNRPPNGGGGLNASLQGSDLLTHHGRKEGKSGTKKSPWRVQTERIQG